MPCSDGLALERIDEERIIALRRKRGMEDSIPNLPWEVVNDKGKTVGAFISKKFAISFLAMIVAGPTNNSIEWKVVRCPC